MNIDYTLALLFLMLFMYVFSEKECEGEYAFEVEKRNKMRTVFITGRDGLTPQQAAILLVQEARMLIQVYIILRFYEILFYLFIVHCNEMVIYRMSWDWSRCHGRKMSNLCK